MSLAATAAAQNGFQFQDWKPLESEARLGPKAGCGDLRSFTGYEVSIVTAAHVPASAEAPKHCRISGQILPEIRFEVSLPAAWNRRFYMFGNGGYAGESLEAPNRVATRNRALQRGFAVAQTNTGHDAATEPLAAFAVNRQKLLDYSFRAVHVTAETGKKLAESHYGLAPARSYFDGCSTGGRQGLILAQRFPADFDGIVVGAPVLNFSATMVSYAWIARGLAAAPIAPAKLKILAERVYATCDPQDGLKDGLITDPRQCRFQPGRDLPKCSGEAEDAGCFTTRQIEALERVYADVMSQGKRFFPGWPAGAEIAGPEGRSGWEPWIVNAAGRTIGVNFSETFFRYMGFPEQDPRYDLSRFDFDRDPGRLGWIHEVLDATDPDLTRFQTRGGKIVMYYGWADPALNPLMGVEYYQQVAERLGARTSGFFRLFMVPGMFHCRGGVGTSEFDALTPLAGWVERSTAPEKIVASRTLNGKVVRTRPLCPYPQVATYQGAGSIDEAGSFTCQAP